MPIGPASDKWICSGLYPFSERQLEDVAFWHELAGELEMHWLSSSGTEQGRSAAPTA
jgi:hypothetical protein